MNFTIDSNYVSSIKCEIVSGNLQITQDNDTVTISEDNLDEFFDSVSDLSDDSDTYTYIVVNNVAITNPSGRQFIEIVCESERITFHITMVEDFLQNLVNMGVVK